MTQAIRVAGLDGARILTPPRLIMAVFFMHAFVMTNWFPRIPTSRISCRSARANCPSASSARPLAR